MIHKLPPDPPPVLRTHTHTHTQREREREREMIYTYIYIGNVLVAYSVKFKEDNMMVIDVLIYITLSSEYRIINFVCY